MDYVAFDYAPPIHNLGRTRVWCPAIVFIHDAYGIEARPLSATWSGNKLRHTMYEVSGQYHHDLVPILETTRRHLLVTYGIDVGMYINTTPI